MCESVGKSDLLSHHFHSKLSHESVDLLLICHQSLSLATFALRSSAVRSLLSDLDPDGGTDPLGMIHFFEEYCQCSSPQSWCGVSAASSFG